MRWKLFFFDLVEWGIKKSFHTDFKNVHLTFVKSAPKNSFAQKPIILDLGKCSIGKIVFWLKLFFGELFTRVICTFVRSVRKDGFLDAPFDLYKEKKFSSLRRDNELLWELKWSKMEETAQNFEKRFFLNRSKIFVALPKFYVTHRNYEFFSKSLVPNIHGSISSYVCLDVGMESKNKWTRIECMDVTIMDNHPLPFNLLHRG